MGIRLEVLQYFDESILRVRLAVQSTVVAGKHFFVAIVP